nr:immunoglobulin heavy chain junction region [Macaca mulatta]MOW98437.1 immunoglobulin heavy chain junction region [Macaca mulatta]MOW98692.1 immunoglobulin heavy chain junction region [Macaca mulatta]MOW99178.1 immunoglobulin heavy chain junction region [Macaca mulatta]MOW99186.1 immunoglobulin heavy chain junction region [Macaca mulatta]
CGRDIQYAWNYGGRVDVW